MILSLRLAQNLRFLSGFVADLQFLSFGAPSQRIANQLHTLAIEE